MDTWSLQQVEEELERFSRSQPVLPPNGLDISHRGPRSNKSETSKSLDKGANLKRSQLADQMAYIDSDDPNNGEKIAPEMSRFAKESNELTAVKYFTDKYSRTGINLLEINGCDDSKTCDTKSIDTKAYNSLLEIRDRTRSPVPNQTSSQRSNVGSRNTQHITPDHGIATSNAGITCNSVGYVSPDARITSANLNRNCQPEVKSQNLSGRLATKSFSNSYNKMQTDPIFSSSVSGRIPLNVDSSSKTDGRTAHGTRKTSVVSSLLSSSLLPMIPLYPTADQRVDCEERDKLGEVAPQNVTGDGSGPITSSTAVFTNPSGSTFTKSNISPNKSDEHTCETVNLLAPLSIKPHTVTIHRNTTYRNCSTEKDRTLNHTGKDNSMAYSLYNSPERYSSSKPESLTATRGSSLTQRSPLIQTKSQTTNSPDKNQIAQSQSNSASLRRGVSLMRSFRASKDLFTSGEELAEKGAGGTTIFSQSKVETPDFSNQLQRQSNFVNSDRDSKIQTLLSPIKSGGAIGNVLDNYSDLSSPPKVNAYRALDVIDNGANGQNESVRSTASSSTREESFHSISEKLDRLSRSNDLLDRIADSNESLYDITDSSNHAFPSGHSTIGSPNSNNDRHFSRGRNCASFRATGKTRGSRNNSSSSQMEKVDASPTKSVEVTLGSAQTLPRQGGRKGSTQVGKSLRNHGLTQHRTLTDSSTDNISTMNSITSNKASPEGHNRRFLSSNSSTDNMTLLDNSAINGQSGKSNNTKIVEYNHANKVNDNRGTKPDGHVRMIENRGSLSERDIQRVEMFYRSHKTDVLVCKCMVDLYYRPANNPTAPSVLGKAAAAVEVKTSGFNGTTDEDMEGWSYAYSGIVVLLLDSGDSRRERRLTIALAERGTGFTLWKDRIDHLSGYRVVSPCLHTIHLSRDHFQLAGFRFQDTVEAEKFHQGLVSWSTVDPNDPLLRISRSGKGQGGWSLRRSFRKMKREKTKPPSKADISAPICFVHVTKLDRGVSVTSDQGNS